MVRIANTNRLDLVSGAIDSGYRGSAGDDPNAPITEDTGFYDRQYLSN